MKLPLRIPRACQRLSLQSAKDWQQLKYIGSLSNLTHLKLQLSHWEDEFSAHPDPHHVDLVHSLAFLPKLQVLKLADLKVPSEITKNFSQCAELVSSKIATATWWDCTWRFEDCHQLTALKLSPSRGSGSYAMAEVLLPPAHNALRRLSLKIPVALHELRHAANVTTLKLSPLCLQSSEFVWPPKCCQLQQILVSLGDDQYAHLPPQWASYSKLTSLTLARCAADDLPDWFLQLKQLKDLALTCSSFRTFPTSLYCLSELQSLDLSYMQCVLDRSIVHLADLPLLTRLKLGDHVYDNETECDDDPISTAEYEALSRGLKQLVWLVMCLCGTGTYLIGLLLCVCGTSTTQTV